MSLKPVFHQPPMLNLPRLPLTPGQVRSNEPQAKHLYRHLKRVCVAQGGVDGVPESWEPLYLLSVLTGEKDQAEEMQAVIDRGMGELLPQVPLREIIWRLRAGFVLFQHYPSPDRLKLLMAGIRVLADRWEEVQADFGLLSSPADLMELLGWLYKATGTAGLLTLGTMLEKAAMDWCGILTTHQQTRDCFQDKEVRAYAALLQQEEGNPAYPATYEMYTAQGELLGDAMRYTLWTGIMTGSKAQLSAPRTGYERITKWHGAVGGGWHSDTLLGGLSAVQGMDTAAVGALCEGLASQLMVTGGEWAILPLDMLFRNAMHAAVGEDALWLFQRDNGLACETMVQHRFAPENQGALHAACRLARGYARYFASSLMATPGGAAWLMTADGRYSLSHLKDQLVLTAAVEGDSGAWRTLRLNQGDAAGFQLEVCLPAWADACRLDVNAKKAHDFPPGTWQHVKHAWKAEDGLHLHVDIPLRLESGHRQGVTFRRGSQVLAIPFQPGDELPAVAVGAEGEHAFFTCPEWRKSEGVPLDIPVLPRGSGHPLSLRLMPYGDCPHRIAVFPRVNPA